MSASFTYPARAAQGTLTPEQVHLLLSNTGVLARRIAELTNQKFIADYLLPSRLDATGGGVFYETGLDEAFAKDSPEAVAPNSEYPKTLLTSGEVSAARTVKWGLETDITDEKIAREGRSVVDRALQRLANTVVRHVDQAAWGVIASKVTTTKNATHAWDTPGAVLETILGAQAERSELGTGLNLNTVVLPPAKYAKLLGMLLDKQSLPREDANPIVGTLPVSAFGLEWVTSPHVVGTDPYLVDRDALGGMGEENLGSPEYSAVNGIEVAANRVTRDAYEVRARRVTVPVVLDPLAGVKITGTNL